MKIPKKRIAEYVAKVKKLLIPFPELQERDEDFYIRKADELYQSKKVR